MEFITTVTQKGQITLPQKMREKSGIKTRTRVKVTQLKDGTITVTPAFTILDMAGKLKPRANRDTDPLHARNAMENDYTRT